MSAYATDLHEWFPLAKPAATLKVAAFQSPVPTDGCFDAVALIAAQVSACETSGVSILCCPEGVLGGLADYSRDPARMAISVENLGPILAPLASPIVTTLVGFSELGSEGKLYNAVAVFHRGRILGVYRKRQPAINRSVYAPGNESPVFTLDGFTYGIMICNDSNFPELAADLVAQGASAIFIPTNNAMPASKKPEKTPVAARAVDHQLATNNKVWIIRADVAGDAGGLISSGSSAITDPYGGVVRSAPAGRCELLIAEIARYSMARTDE